MSRAERRRAEQAARKQAEHLASQSRQRARRERARLRHRDAVERKPSGPLLVDLAKFVWSAFRSMELRKYRDYLGVLAVLGRGMGIDTRDPRLPKWTGLSKPPGKPEAASRPGRRAPRG